VIAPIDFSKEVLQRVWFRYHDPDARERLHLSLGSLVCRSKERDQTLIYAEAGQPVEKRKIWIVDASESSGLIAFQWDRLQA